MEKMEERYLKWVLGMDRRTGVFSEREAAKR